MPTEYQIGHSIIIIQIQNMNHTFFCYFLDCPDLNDNCPGWALWGECSKNPGYMLYYCMKSCNVDCNPGKEFELHETVI